jgi:very-short-patch-repair endonuclease
VTVRQIEHRVATGRLHPVGRGVYAVGHRVLSVEGRWRAAALSSGSGAVLSHSTAAAVWELRPAGGGAIHVTVPGRGGRRHRRGIAIHRSVTLGPRDVTARRGLPVTSVARTIIDLARTLPQADLERIVDLADQRGLVDFADLRTANSAALKAVLSNYRPAPTRSELERRFLRLCDDHGVERPETNTRIEDIEVDFVWRDRRLIVEVDGYAYHRSPAAFELDRERDVRLGAVGWRVLRFTWRQVTQRPAWVAGAVR